MKARIFSSIQQKIDANSPRDDEGHFKCYVLFLFELSARKECLFTLYLLCSRSLLMKAPQAKPRLSEVHSEYFWWLPFFSCPGQLNK